MRVKDFLGLCEADVNIQIKDDHFYLKRGTAQKIMLTGSEEILDREIESIYTITFHPSYNIDISTAGIMLRVF